MGDHDSWYTLLMPEFWAQLELGAAEHLTREQTFMMFQGTHFTLMHVAGALLAFIFILILAVSLSGEPQGLDQGRRAAAQVRPRAR